MTSYTSLRAKSSLPLSKVALVLARLFVSAREIVCITDTFYGIIIMKEQITLVKLTSYTFHNKGLICKYLERPPHKANNSHTSLWLRQVKGRLVSCSMICYVFCAFAVHTTVAMYISIIFISGLVLRQRIASRAFVWRGCCHCRKRGWSVGPSQPFIWHQWQIFFLIAGIPSWVELTLSNW